MPILKTLIFSILVPATVTIYLPYLLLATRPAEASAVPLPLRIAGGLLIALGAGIYLRCAWDFAVFGRGTPAPIDPPGFLVARGLYCFTRNPMYVGILFVLIGECAWLRSGRMCVYAVAVFALFHSFVILHEEPVLRKTFGNSYEQYRRTVPRWIDARTLRRLMSGGA